MNHLLHFISWQQYLTAALVSAMLYYLLLMLRYYRPELQNLRRRMTGDLAGNQLQALQYQPAEAAPGASPTQNPEEQSPFDPIAILSGQLRACIAKATGKTEPPEVLITKLKCILQNQLELTAIERQVMNRLLVRECKNTGTALLTEGEVDQWWSG